MSQYQQTAPWLGDIAADAQPDSRADFIRKTYAHLAGAIGAFIILQVLIFQLVPTATLESILGSVLFSPYMWLVVLGAFMAVSWVARSWADSATSVGVQYAGLGLYVVAQAIIFVPLLYTARGYYAGAITTAGISTLAIFTAITAFAFISGKNFSFLGGALAVAGMAALVVIVLSIVPGFELGLIFVVLMIALAGGFILYDTSNVIHNYRIGQHVAASLALFASVALLFWYVLRLVMMFSGRD